MDGGITERLRPGAQLSLDGATGLLRVRRYQLRVSSGPDVGKTQPLDGTVMVGTAAEVGFRLTDASVSRYHLELQVRAEGVHVRDLGSTNGTSVEGARIQELTAVDLAFFAGRTGLRIERVFEEGGVALLPLGLDHFGEVVGASAGMRRIFALLTQVAPLDVGVLLLGETGTGKELLARALHKASGRGAFVTVDSGSLSPSLAEGELFGHVRGAFTGATSDREGLLAQAEGGDALPRRERLETRALYPDAVRARGDAQVHRR